MNVDKRLIEAEKTCTQSGTRLTNKRKQVLLLLLRSEKPLSAYEISDQLKASIAVAIPPMSVYRMLDFLINENLVHKICSTGKYVACSHTGCSQPHPLAQFLICDACGSVQEVDTDKRIAASLEAGATEAGYALHRPQIELHCVCRGCAADKA